MTHEQRLKYVEDLLSSGKCRAEAFHYLGHQLIAGKIDEPDYFKMADLLGFTIEPDEIVTIFESLSKECCKVNCHNDSDTPIQKETARA